jgi:GNAT superfamily N-acetyltransferase
MDAAISPAAVADRDGIVDLLGRQFAEHSIELSPARLAAVVDGVFEDPSRGAFLVARREGRVIGIACLSFVWAFEHGGLSAWLDELYVLPELRGGGIGRALLHAALDHARDRGCAAVDLEVEADHARAANLYAREGFTPHRRARWVKPLGSG